MLVLSCHLPAIRASLHMNISWFVTPREWNVKDVTFLAIQALE